MCPPLLPFHHSLLTRLCKCTASPFFSDNSFSLRARKSNSATASFSVTSKSAQFQHRSITNIISWRYCKHCMQNMYQKNMHCAGKNCSTDVPTCDEKAFWNIKAIFFGLIYFFKKKHKSKHSKQYNKLSVCTIFTADSFKPSIFQQTVQRIFYVSAHKA